MIELEELETEYSFLVLLFKIPLLALHCSEHQQQGWHTIIFNYSGQCHPWCVVTVTLSGQPQQCVGHCQFCCFRPTPTTWLQQKWRLMMPPCPWGTCWLGGPLRKRSVTDTHTDDVPTFYHSLFLIVSLSPSLPHAHTFFTPSSPTHAVTCTLKVGSGSQNLNFTTAI